MTATVARAPHVLEAPVLDETVVLDPERGEYYRLNPVGTRVWELLASGPRSLDDLVETVVGEYDVNPARARTDVVALLDRLVDRGLVDVRG
jgi:PqqD family protein of HPr-rel-A system